MKAPAAVKVIKALGGDKATRFVGGCVRNWVVGEEMGDIDLATKLVPEDVMTRLKTAGIKTIPTGLAHGTITAVCDKSVFEVTTLRRDVETDGRHAVVEFTDDWAEDARRRDFTMNTLSADLAGTIYDPLGTGIADLKKGRVIFVGEAAERIAEDYLRVLRFFRFHARYGKGAPDPHALAACAAASRKIKTLSKERVTQEFLKILKVPKSAAVLTLMRDSNILKGVISAAYSETVFNDLIKKQKDVSDHAMAARLVTLGGLKRSGVSLMAKSLRLPNRTLTQMTAIMDSLKILSDVSKHSVKLSLYRVGIEATRQALYLKKAHAKYLAMDDVPVFKITGKDLIREGFTAGPELGLELKKREAAWIRNDFT